MRTIALSKRDIIKEASIEGTIRNTIKGVIESVGDKKTIISKPFETIFSTAAPFLFRTNFILKTIWMIAELNGVGPGTWIGKWLDNFFGFGDPDNPPKVGETDIESAAEGLADTMLAPLGGLSATAEHFVPLNKTAFRLGRRSKFRRILRGQRGGIVGLIYKLLYAFLMGLVGAGIYGGVSGALLGPKSEREVGEEKKHTTETPQESQPKLQRYKNMHLNIERSLIEYMNAAVNKTTINGMQYNFEQAFEMLRHYPLQGSPEMRKALKEISGLYEHKPIQELNKFETFYGPDVVEIITKVMPEIRKSKPKETASPVSKSKQVSKRDPKSELKQLLKGVFNE